MDHVCFMIIGAGVAWLLYDLIKTIREDGWEVAISVTLVIIFAAVIVFFALVGIGYTITIYGR